MAAAIAKNVIHRHKNKTKHYVSKANWFLFESTDLTWRRKMPASEK